MDQPCKTCGQRHVGCAAHSRGGRPCGRWPADGANVCASHGGAAPQVQQAVAERRRRQAAEAAVARFGLPIEIDPAQALLEEVHRSAGHEAWLRAQVAALVGVDPERLVYGTRGIRHQKGIGPEGPVDVTTVDTGPGVHEWVRLWQAERQHLVKVSAAALAAGAQERLVTAAERQAELLGTIVAGLADDLGLQGAARAQLFGHAERRFELLHGGARPVTP